MAVARKCFAHQHRRIRGALFAVLPNCWYCGRPLTKQGTYRPTLDHIIPRSRGGSDGIKNLALACAGCNAIKKDKYLCEVGMSFFFNIKNLRSKAKALIRGRAPTTPKDTP